jgi:hypothetical protein
MRLLLILATAWSLLCSPAFAQVGVGDPLTATPSLGTTSPLGMSAGGSVGPTGIPLDATELTSLGVSPAPTGSVTGTIAIPTGGAITTGGTTCSTGGMSPSGMYGSIASYDGGGTAPGTAAPATAATTRGMAGTPVTAATTDPTAMAGTSTSSEMSVPTGTSTTSLDTSGMSGMCGSGSSSVASSSTPTSTAPTVPGGVARTGIPFGSMEINNLGISSAPAVPLPAALPIAGTVGPSSLAPTLPVLPPATSAATCSISSGVGSAGTGGAGDIGSGSAGISGTSISARMLRQAFLCAR